MIEINFTPTLAVLVIVIFLLILFHGPISKKIINICNIKSGHISIDFKDRDQSKSKKSKVEQVNVNK